MSRAKQTYLIYNFIKFSADVRVIDSLKKKTHKNYTHGWIHIIIELVLKWPEFEATRKA